LHTTLTRALGERELRELVRLCDALVPAESA
jgi:hypothetical protein